MSPSRSSRTPLALAAGAFALGAVAVGPSGHAARTATPFTSAPAPTSPAHAAHADCLWYSARNNGFYLVQRDAVRPGADARTRAAWEGFLDAAGGRDCPTPGGGVETVVAALAASADDADRHFLGGAR